MSTDGGYLLLTGNRPSRASFHACVATASAIQITLSEAEVDNAGNHRRRLPKVCTCSSVERSRT